MKENEKEFGIVNVAKNFRGKEFIDDVRGIFKDLPSNFEDFKGRMFCRAIEHLLENGVMLCFHKSKEHPGMYTIGIPDEIFQDKEKLNGFLNEMIFHLIDFGIEVARLLEWLYFYYKWLKLVKTDSGIPKATVYRYLAKGKWIEEVVKEYKLNGFWDILFDWWEKRETITFVPFHPRERGKIPQVD